MSKVVRVDRYYGVEVPQWQLDQGSDREIFMSTLEFGERVLKSAQIDNTGFKESTNGDRVGEPTYRADPYDGSQGRTS